MRLLDRLLGPLFDWGGKRLVELPGWLKIGVISAVLIASLAVPIWFALGTPDIISAIRGSAKPPKPTEQASPSARFTSHSDGSSVTELGIYEGEYQNLPEGDCIWLLFDTPSNDRLYRQGPVWPLGDGTFIRRATIGSGDEDDYGQEYVIFLAWVPKSTCEAWKNEPGFDAYLLPIDPLLPEGVVRLSSITVVLTEPTPTNSLTPTLANTPAPTITNTPASTPTSQPAPTLANPITPKPTSDLTELY